VTPGDALPPRLRNRVEVKRHPDLLGDTVRVVPDYHPNGHIRGVKVEIGPNARAIDIQKHVGVIDTMRKYTGLLGRLRVTLQGVQIRLGMDIVSPLRKGQFEAALELQKLPGIIEERIGRLAKEGADPRARAEIEADIAHLEHQYQKARDNFELGAAAESVGYVAAEARKRTKKGAAAEEQTLEERAVDGDEKKTRRKRGDDPAKAEGESKKKLAESKTEEPPIDPEALAQSNRIIDEIRGIEEARAKHEQAILDNDTGYNETTNHIRENTQSYVEALRKIREALPYELRRKIDALGFDATPGQLVAMHRQLIASPEYQKALAVGRPVRAIDRLNTTAPHIERMIEHDLRLEAIKGAVAYGERRINDLLVEFEGMAGGRVFNGVALHPNLDIKPAAGTGYTPKTLSDSSPAHAQAHIQGYRSEIRLANEIARAGEEKVILFGDKTGTNGADVISVNKQTGDVTLWDAKYRSAGAAPDDSPTFSLKHRRENAVAQAVALLDKNTFGLSKEVVDMAKAKLAKKQYLTITSHTDGGAFRHEKVAYDGGIEVPRDSTKASKGKKK
jgi:hypothetical protein